MNCVVKGCSLPPASLLRRMTSSRGNRFNTQFATACESIPPENPTMCFGMSSNLHPLSRTPIHDPAPLHREEARSDRQHGIPRDRGRGHGDQPPGAPVQLAARALVAQQAGDESALAIAADFQTLMLAQVRF